MRVQGYFFILVLVGCGEASKPSVPSASIQFAQTGDFSYSFSSTSTQTFAPAESTGVKGVRVEFAPGALAIDAKISIAVAVDEVPIPEGALRVGQPYAITATGEGDLSILAPMSLTFPLPLSLALTDGGRTAVSYRGYNGAGELVSGVIEDLTEGSGNLQFKTSYWGSYQIIRFAD